MKPVRHVRHTPVRTVLAGLFIASALGAGPGSWTAAGPFRADGTSVPIHAAAAAGETAFAGGEDGIYRSDDGGTTWQRQAFDENRNGAVLTLAIPEGQTETVFAGTSAGVFVTRTSS